MQLGTTRPKSERLAPHSLVSRRIQSVAPAAMWQRSAHPSLLVITIRI
jgi:hypothetical protein